MGLLHVVSCGYIHDNLFTTVSYKDGGLVAVSEGRRMVDAHCHAEEWSIADGRDFGAFYVLTI